MKPRTSSPFHDKKLRNTLLLPQFLLGLVAFFIFFAAMFNGLDRLMVVAAVSGLALNFLVSWLIGRKNVRNGRAAALAFAAPPLLFSVFALGDAVVYGKLAPFLFWSSSGVVVLTSGLLGVAVARSGGDKSRN